MAQQTDIIDLRRSYIPQDPNAFPVTQHNTQGEDSPEARIPVLPYDGFNFMPTPQGYASFFGVNGKLDIPSIFSSDAIPEVPPTYGPSTYTYPLSATELAMKDWACAYWGAADWDEFLSWFAVDTDQEFLEQTQDRNGAEAVANLSDAIYWIVTDDGFDEDAVADFVSTFGGDREETLGPVLDPGSPAIPANIASEGEVDDIFFIQTTEYINILVALCDDGIWTIRPTSGLVWVQEIPLDIPENIHREWSKCVIDNVVYVYRQGEEVLWTAAPENQYVFEEQTPIGINMAGQLGIFKAGGRLGFWDSENSTGWSSLTEKLEFGDSEKLSGFTIFQDIVGRIVNVLQHGDGFIIYCTKSIVHARRNVGSAFLFSGSSIFNNNGISYRRESCFADPDTLHIASTTQGLVEINSGKAELIMPEVSTYLKARRLPIYLKMLNGRYLHFHILDPNYLTGIANFSSELSGGAYSWGSAATAVDNFEEGNGKEAKTLSGAELHHDQIYLYNNYGYTNYGQATVSGGVPIWEDVLQTLIPINHLEGWKNAKLGLFGNTTYFKETLPADTTTPAFAFPAMESGGGTYNWLPGGMESAYAAGWNSPDAIFAAPTNLIEPNNNNFYSKQEWLWYLEWGYTEDWLEAAMTYPQPDWATRYNSYTFYSTSAAPGSAIQTYPVQSKFDGDVNYTTYKSNWYPHLAPRNERNKYYGLSNKSAWLQRSLVQLMQVTAVESRRTIFHTSGVAPWIMTGNMTGASYADEAPNYAAGIAQSQAAFQTLYPGSTPVLTPDPERATWNLSDGAHYISGFPAGDPNVFLPVGEIYIIGVREYQGIAGRGVNYRTIDTCIVKELGHTRITGHGHYTDLGNTFVQDNGTDEAADYTDICIADPEKKRKPQFNGISIQPPWNPSNGFYGNNQIVEINGDTYTPETFGVALPDTNVLLQDGSIEPLHPLFLGAFVFDLQYKKWGKMEQDHLMVLDLYPVNNVAGQPLVYENFLPRSAALLSDGYIYPFDAYPEDSRIVFGKYGSHRRGFTDLHELEIQQRIPMTGTVTVEGSLNGRDVEATVSKTESYENSRQHKLHASLSARWYNIIIEGFFDLTYLAVNSTRGSRR